MEKKKSPGLTTPDVFPAFWGLPPRRWALLVAISVFSCPHPLLSLANRFDYLI